MLKASFLAVSRVAMIDENEIVRLIGRMRRTGSDTQMCEVKEAVQGLPKSLAETLSAFSNMHGGLVILGISEKNGFHFAQGFDADRIYSQLQTVGDALTPPVRPEIERIPFEGHTIVVARVHELPGNLKPCHITAQGKYSGSFIRSGDGDRHLSAYEVDRLSEGSIQPQYDIEPVEQASVEDLNPETLRAVVRRARDLFPRVFGRLADETILIQLGVLTRLGERVCPTLSGLLAAGVFPQQYFPGLQIDFAVYPGTTKAGDPETGKRYLDAKELVGSIPDMLTDAVALVQQKMSTGAVVRGALRKDVTDYPLVAVREAIANALQHRDYSPEGRGTRVQVNMYSDRLEITNPGGLYGATTVESLGKEGISSTRNEFLSRLLTYTPYDGGFVVENKGTGFMTIELALAQALMPPPKVQNSITFFSLSFEKRRRTADEMMSRSWARIDEAILAEMAEKGSLSIRELTEMSALSRVTISKHVRQLIKDARVEPTETKKSPKQRYRLVR